MAVRHKGLCQLGADFPWPGSRRRAYEREEAGVEEFLFVVSPGRVVPTPEMSADGQDDGVAGCRIPFIGWPKSGIKIGLSVSK